MVALEARLGICAVTAAQASCLSLACLAVVQLVADSCEVLLIHDALNCALPDCDILAAPSMFSILCLANEAKLLYLLHRPWWTLITASLAAGRSLQSFFQKSGLKRMTWAPSLETKAAALPLFSPLLLTSTSLH